MAPRTSVVALMAFMALAIASAANPAMRGVQEREAHRQLQGGEALCVEICKNYCEAFCSELGQGDECTAACRSECASGCSEGLRRRRLQQLPAHLQRENDTNSDYRRLSPYQGPHYYGDYLHDNHTATTDYEEEPSAAGGDHRQLQGCKKTCHDYDMCDSCLLGHWNEYVGCEGGYQKYEVGCIGGGSCGHRCCGSC
ncbi:unnamed protein product [Vitrella brassicaformis CCMP3155]|uniref:ShKT domain-containing protein n=1 Tax=Vitrella brassicaformis (strain CCMP3155) TaxID=1169540 RepID=A0A0G4FKM7_VITBC|nr:unnamed protein product [Vitrella brassicaformis CCMP3155]|eukprot:CEM14548.1 unnamed protein product [Vitrella brassicaformis CCMP3155]